MFRSEVNVLIILWRNGETMPIIPCLTLKKPMNPRFFMVQSQSITILLGQFVIFPRHATRWSAGTQCSAASGSRARRAARGPNVRSASLGGGLEDLVGDVYGKCWYFMVILWWFYGDFMVVFWWFYGDLVGGSIKHMMILIIYGDLWKHAGFSEDIAVKHDDSLGLNSWDWMGI